MIEYRDAEGKAERLPVIAAELVALKVDVIVAVTGNNLARSCVGIIAVEKARG